MLDRRLIIVTGKGGAGRSAVASAIARDLASSGRRALALAIDRGAGLAAHLGSPKLGHEPTAIQPDLSAAIVDPSSALDEYVRLRAGSMPVAMAARVFRVLALTVPGVRDIVLIGKVWYEAERGGWDAVVVDAAPAGQIQSIVQAPGTIADLVPRGTIHDQALEMAATLGDDRATELVVVATPEELSLAEADEVLAAADAARLSTARHLVLNRVLEPAGFSTPPESPGARADAARLQLEVEAAQRELMSGVRPDLVLPLILGTHGATEVSRVLAGKVADR